MTNGASVGHGDREAVLAVHVGRPVVPGVAVVPATGDPAEVVERLRGRELDHRLVC